MSDVLDTLFRTILERQAHPTPNSYTARLLASGGDEILNEKFKTFDRNGNAMYVIANLSPIRSEEGKIVGLLGILRNITDIHLMERKLKVNSKRLEEKIKEQILSRIVNGK